MRKSKFAEDQIAYALKQAELGIAVSEVRRKMGDQRRDLLQVACQVRGRRPVRASPVAPRAASRAPKTGHRR